MWPALTGRRTGGWIVRILLLCLSAASGQKPVSSQSQKLARRLLARETTVCILANDSYLNGRNHYADTWMKEEQLLRHYMSIFHPSGWVEIVRTASQECLTLA
ncbi:hypothetical protein GGI35DRAFT_174596 [Trichoderma velutinum]